MAHVIDAEQMDDEGESRASALATRLRRRDRHGLVALRPQGSPFRALSVVTQRYNLDPEIEYHRAREITIAARRPLPVQVDGDHIGQTPMTFVAVPGALRALLPEKTRRA